MIEYARIILLSALFLVAFMLWNAWENDTARKSPPVLTRTDQTVASVGEAADFAVQQPSGKRNQTAQLIQVQTDVFDLKIDPIGGDIVQTRLLKYPQALHSPTPYTLITNDPDKLYITKSGLIGKQGQIPIPTDYSTEQTNYVLQPNQNQLIVELKGHSSNGLLIYKQFVFKRDNYEIGVNYQIDNRSIQPWEGKFYAQLQRKKLPLPKRGLFVLNPYIGGAISSPDKPYQKVSFSKMAEENLDVPIQGGWAAMLEHYFLSAWIPDKSQTYNYYTQVQGDVYTLGMISQTITLTPGDKTTINATLYLGPEIMDRLKAVAPNLDLTIDYGILWFISIAIFWVMKQIYQVVGNWGWSIVIVTALIKLAFYHLSAKSYRSMAAMRKLHPRLQSLKERYGDDRQKMTKATMELYKKEKINPMSGCLPIIVQIPVFIALYWVLLESVELRQAPFILWIHDLSAKDPYYILPLIMGLTMFIQQRLNPPPADPVQARMMQFLPIFFVFLFVSFPSGLVLYWVVNNTLSILQQWHITRKIEKKAKNKK